MTDQVFPRPSPTLASDTPPPSTAKKPQAPSRALRSARYPLLANRAAKTPFSAARPTCNGFVMVPKLQRIPAAKLAAIPSPFLSCCLLYTSDAADDLLCVDLGGR